MNETSDKLGLQAVIVLYNCSPQQSPALAGFYQATRSFPGRISLLLYDNSPKPAGSLPVLAGLNIVYQHDETNSGISRAYNVAARMATQNGMNWLLLLDQDTSVTADFLSNFAESLAKNQWCKVFAPVLMDKQQQVSPFHWHWGRGSGLKKALSPGNHKFTKLALANSGLIVNIEFFYRLGGYTEEIKLDFADIDFCNKIEFTGEEFYLLNSTLEHSLTGLRGENLGDLIIRFTRYSRSAKIFAKRHRLVYRIGLRLFIKALILSFKFKNLRFVKIFAKEYLLNKGAKN